MQKSIIGILFIGLFSCNQNKVSEFSLLGKTNGFENGTVLYLYNPDTSETIDSAIVNENRFIFNTVLPKSPMRFYLHNKDVSKYTTFWAENNKMLLDASTTDLRNATITGSETEKISRPLYRAIDTVSRSERSRLEKKFVNDHPNSIVSANLLSTYSIIWGKEKTKELFDKFSVENKNTQYGKQIAKFIELNENPKIGDNYIDFEMTNQNGAMNKLSDFDKKVVLLEFWASWCRPCREENPSLVKTYETFNQKGFEVFAISMDRDKNNWLKAIEKDSLAWKHVSELNGEKNTAAFIYGVNEIPDNFLIDRNGIIVGRNLRREKLNEKLAQLLN